MFTSGQWCSHLIHTYHHDQDVCHKIHNLHCRIEHDVLCIGVRRQTNHP
ncbi:hypothetical protein AI2618V1_4207 [Serratia marcescens]|nr:hypothetical protein SK68_04635 [Serratia marcescens]KMJ17422.1 hypothetical protein SN03_00095 [Serratia marcescens]CAB1222211.1 hypothetical protein FB6_3278 [Serratia marcescens]CAE7338591.1 hypothetical protein AI2618V1_4207 [Serratia marcescens]CAE7340478.1 hypothetical protein AI2617V1_4275 [Serratia marcescens]